MLSVACCHSRPAPGPKPQSMHTVRLLGQGQNRSLQLLVACDAAQHARGLMGRRSLGKSDGMLFVFGRAAPRSFWMHDTLLPLDMLFFDDAGRLTCVIDQAQPETDAPRSCALPSRYVVELAGGTAGRWGLSSDAHLLPAEIVPLCTDAP